MIVHLFDFENVKLKKAGVMLWYNHLPSLKKLFRLIELCLAPVLLFWIFNRLPFVLRLSGEFLQQIAAVIVTPIFIFFLCNAIIVTLIFKTGRFSGENPAPDSAEIEFYEEFLKNNENCCSKTFSPENPFRPPSPTHSSFAAEEVECQDKEMISPANAVTHTGENDQNIVEIDMLSVSDSELESESDSETPKVYRKWKSEKLERKFQENMKVKKLRRSETEKGMNMVKSTVGGGKGFCPGDDLSDEEFQRAVDEFIAKHLMFRRQESLTVVLQN